MTAPRPDSAPTALDAQKPVESDDRSSISVVIPTRNRRESLLRLLASIASQDRPVDEVLILDASDDPIVLSDAASLDCPAQILHVGPSLCRQRNEGVRLSRGSLVLLCDDDVELPTHYVRKLSDHLSAHPSDGAVTGAFRERGDDDEFLEAFPAPSMRRLVMAFLFQLSVWGDLEAVDRSRRSSALLQTLKLWYGRRGNTWSLAGWPLLTQVRDSVVHVAVYSLGAALVRRDWLVGSPYDERLGPHGIGDHYGVAIGFPRCPGIALLTDLEVLHHRAPDGRMPAEDAQLERVLALHYFIRKSPRFTWWSRAWLIWSLVGTASISLIRGRWPLLRRTLTAAGLILIRRNPLEEPRGGAATEAS